MSYQNSYIPRLPELDLEDDSYLLPQLCSVPPELEVPELVIPIPNTKREGTSRPDTG